MKKKIIGIIIGMLLCLTAIEIYPQTIKVKALVPDEVKLNYQKIHEFTQKLSNIVFEDEGILNGIRMGRYFGTPGDRYAGNLTLAWMEKFAKFYIDSHQMIDYPTKDIIGLDATVELKRFSFNLSKNGCEAIISNDECYLLPKTTLLSDYADYSDENIKVERFYPWEWNKLEDYESMFNISYTRFQYSDQNFVGELTYISNYTRATKNETFMKTHLIDCSDDEFNDTTNLVANSNGSAFILMRDNITNITNCELPVPGIAVTKENGSLLYNLTQNDSLYVAVFLPYENPIPDKGYMTIYTCPIIAPLCSPKLLLVTIDDATNWQTTAQTVRLCVRGVIVSDPAFDDRHWMTVPTGENAIPGKVWDDNPHNLGRNYHSSMLKPYYFINNTIYCNNGHQHKIFEWYEEPGDLYADYSGHQKDVHKNSYNVYCTISGSNPIHDKRVIVSGGHLDGFPGQMPIDDAIGSATMLGILKYMNDSKIIPKYDITFIAFSGEEWIDRGSRDWVLNHILENNPPANSVVMFINLDVLAYIGCTTLNIQCSNHDLEKAKNTAKIVENMSCLTNYNGIANVTPASDNYGSPETNDAYAFYLQGIPFIEFGEQQYWNIRHKTGCSHSKGDVMSELDYNDLNRTTDIVWNVTKYYCVNPDCWFSNGVTYQAVDSPNDGDTLADSIQATFTVNSAIHHDEIMVKGILIDDSTGEKVATVCKNFTVISSEVTGSISVLIPSTYDEGDFRLSLELYNSTGKINVIVNPGGDYDDDTDSSPGSFHLFHPFGYIIAGKFGQSINNRITGSVFTIHQNGIADSITAYVSFLLSKPSKCMIYRLSDSKLIGVTQEISGSTSPGGEWRTYPFSEPKPVLVKDTQYVLVCWCGGIFGCLYYNNFVNPRGRYDYEPYGVPPQYIGFTNENRLYSIYCSYTSPQAQSTYYFNGYNILEAWATNPGYMVDGLINRFASSNISEDVEWCNSNNCSGTNLGDISKVEIRAYTYRTGGLGNMILRPVFGASSDGNNHGFTPPLGLKYATWSSWFDVTNDNHAPTTWTWSDIKNLDCDVEVGASGSFPNPTMYCSKIEVRVTYSP